MLVNRTKSGDDNDNTNSKSLWLYSATWILFFLYKKEIKLRIQTRQSSVSNIMRSSWAPPDDYKNKVEFGSSF